MVVTVDASGVAIREADLDGVVADDGGGLRAWLGFEHWKRWISGGPRSCCGAERFFFAALVVACGAGTFLTQISEIVVAGVAIRPGDVHSSAGLHVYFNGGRLSSWIEWNGHARRRRQLLGFPLQQSPGGMGLPCGHVFGWPRNVQMR